MTNHKRTRQGRSFMGHGVLAVCLASLGTAVPATAQQGWTGTVDVVAGAAAPQVAIDGDGDAVAVWLVSSYVPPSPPSSILRAAHYSAASGSWEAPHSLSPAGESAIKPRVAMDGDGNAVAVWSQHGPDAFRVRVARYAAPSHSWAAPLTLSVGPVAAEPQVALSAGGDAFVVWIGAGGLQWARYSAAQDAWTLPLDIPVGAAPRTLRLAVDAIGNAIVVWCAGYPLAPSAVQSIRYDVGTGTWGATAELTASGQLGADPHVAADAAGNAIAVWSLQVSTGPWGGVFVVQAAHYRIATATWSAPRDVSLAGAGWSEPHVAMSAAGDGSAVWMRAGFIQAARYEASADAWSAAVDLTPTPGPVDDSQMDPQVEMDAAGNATAVWQGWTDSRRSIKAARFAQGAWQPTTMAIHPYQFFEVPDVAVSPAGTAVMVWGMARDAAMVLQTVRWEARPRAPRITGVAPAPGTLTVHVAPPVTTESAFAPSNYAYSLDDGGTWTTRSPASAESPIAIAGLSDFVTYAIRVRALNDAGAGAPSSPVRAIAGPVPGPPIALTATSMVGNTLTIAWTAPSGGLTPTGYLLEGGLQPGEVLASIPTGGVAPTLTLVAPTGAFYIRVVAVAGTIRSAPSNEIQIFVNVPAPPSAPANLQGLVDGFGLALSWTNTFAGGAPTSLRLNVSGALTATLPLSMGETFTYANVPPGTYSLSVVAANASGVSAPSNNVTVTFPGPCTGVPGVATNLQTWKVGNTIFVAWSPPEAGTAVTSYGVLVTGAYVGGFGTTSRTLSGVAAPGEYVISVIANNVCGAGPATPAQTVVVP